MTLLAATAGYESFSPASRMIIPRTSAATLSPLSTKCDYTLSVVPGRACPWRTNCRKDWAGRGNPDSGAREVALR